MQCPVFVLATDEGHSAVTEMFGKNRKKNPISANVGKCYSMNSPSQIGRAHV